MKKRKIKKSYKKSFLLFVAFILSLTGFYEYSPYIMPIARKIIENLSTDNSISGNVLRVSDGDTITILDENNEEKKIRLYGVDAPEIKQKYGVQSQKILYEYISGKTVSINIIDSDRYGRYVGIIYVNDVNINEKMVAEGHAWYYDTYCKKSFCASWKAAQDKARKDRKGLWNFKNPQPPWEYRKN